MHAPIGWALHLMALMPWWVLYLHADVFYFFFYHPIGYRKKVVRQNLAESFPEKDGRKHKVIDKDFFADQHPWTNDEGLVLDFLNHHTAFITGDEAIGRRLALNQQTMETPHAFLDGYNKDNEIEFLIGVARNG